MTSPLSVQAILGPFSSVDEAKCIQQEWRKPHDKSNLMRLQDPKKGLEKEGRTLARKYNTSMIEYWSFLETYCDLKTDQGLAELDSYLHEKMECTVGITQRFNNTPVETSYNGSFNDTKECWVQNQGEIEQGKLHQLQDVLAELHITPNAGASVGILDQDPSVNNILDSTVKGTENLHCDHVNKYLVGKTPTETDRQVYELIKDLNVEQFPSIKGWKILLETYTMEEREEWQSYEKQMKTITSDLLISQSSIVNDVKSKLSFEDD
jgi:hypothetical protein